MSPRTLSTRTGVGRILVFVYGIFALAATARAVVQLATQTSRAPVAYSLSLFSGVVYIAATWALATDHRRIAIATVLTEVTGDRELQAVRARLEVRVRRLRRSVHIRHVDVGSDGSDEWEVQALLNPVYDVHRLGIFFTASPRHADILLVTGIGAPGMRAPLARTREAMPDPVVVIATGTDAVSGGLFRHGYGSSGGVGGLLDVDVWVPGSPASPFSILQGILLALDRLPESADARGHR